MKTKPIIPMITLAILGLTTFLTGCPKKASPVVLSDVSAPASTSPTAASSPALPPANTSDDKIAAPRWIDIKDCIFDNRAQFFSGLEKLEAQVDVQIRELNAKRATMKSTVDTKDWDFAMKEMSDSRDYLKSTGEELHSANPETWNQLKDKVGQAWVRTQEAYDKVKASTTT